MDKRITVGVVCLLVGLLLGWIISECNMKEFHDQGKLLYEIDSLQVLSVQQDSIIADLKSQRKNEQSQVDSVKTKIVYIKEKAHEKIRLIDSLSDNELYDAFTRFKTGNNSH